MHFKDLEVKDTIVRIKGQHCSSYDYGVIANIDNSLSYYPLDITFNLSHFWARTNKWYARAARATLGLPRKYIFSVNRDIISQNSDRIEDRMEEIQNADLEKQVDLYVKHAVLPYVIINWKNRVWPINKKHFNTSQKEILDLFLERGNFT